MGRAAMIAHSFIIILYALNYPPLHRRVRDGGSSRWLAPALLKLLLALLTRTHRRIAGLLGGRYAQQHRQGNGGLGTSREGIAAFAGRARTATAQISDRGARTAAAALFCGTRGSIESHGSRGSIYRSTANLSFCAPAGSATTRSRCGLVAHSG
jgi:hypothetical protein